MNCIILIASFLLSVVLLPYAANSQTMKEVNDFIGRSLAKIDSLAELDEWSDSLPAVNTRLRKYLVKVLPRIPESITATVPAMMASGGIRIVTSTDGRLRQWAWDTKTGGSMPEIYMLLQYKTPNGSKVMDMYDAEDKGNTPDWFDTIFTITAKNGKSYYLPITQSKYSNRDAATTISAYTIAGDKLKPVKLFKTRKEKLSSISIDYDYHKSYEWYWAQGKAKFFVDEKKGRLHVPIVEVDSVTNGYLQYDFDGEQFVFKKTVRK